MSGDGSLQQRTTYLISLTLVKVEAVEENGGDTESIIAKREAPTGLGTQSGDSVGAEEARVKGETETEGDAGAFGAQQLGDEGSLFVKREKSIEFQDKRRSPLKDKPCCTVNAPRTSSGKPQCKLSIPLGSEKAMTPKSPGTDLTQAEKSLCTSEAKQTKSPLLTTIPQTEVAEPVRTPTRTSLPIRPVGQQPVSLLKSHSSVATRGRDSRESRERSPTSAQSLDRKDCRMPTRSPGPCRASWAETSRTEVWRDLRDDAKAEMKMDIGGGTAAMLRDMPRKDRFKSGSTSLPAPATQVTKPPRKGKSRTLDNSDLNSLSEDLALTREAQQGQRGASKDRKMLKFISGIFTKSSSGVAGSSSSAAPIFIQRDSSEEEVNIANSQEWSLSRSIPELRLGILGNLKSGKSALVTKYITGSYVALEKPDGGRYKKEVLVDGQSYLLLIREETGQPDAQFSSWVDAVILVFSLENEGSFQELYQLYSQLDSHRTVVPIIVVGTQDKISSTNPRVIEDQRARQLCIDVRHSLFYETCATYGFNIDRVFAEAAQKIVAQKKQAALQACKSLPNSPSHSGGSTPGSASFPGQNRDTDKRGNDPKGDSSNMRGIPIKQSILWKRSGSSLNKEWKKKYVTLSKNGSLSYHSSSSDYMQNIHGKEIDLLRVTVKVPGKRPPRAVAPAGPSPVPTGSGVNGLGRELTAAENTSTVPQLCPSTLSVVDGGLSPQGGDRGLQHCSSSLSAKAQSVDALEGASSQFSGKDASQSSPMADRKKNRRKKSMNQKADAAVGQAEAKRKMWKLKSFGSLRNINKTDEENADFIIVSFTGQTWHFEAQSLEDRDSWVSAIESQILASLQSCESGRNKARRSSQSEAVALQGIRNTKGNNLCVDCEAQNPTWASLNLGALICIECSGIHRNLGTHLSRVRSLDLDDWPGELTQVLSAIGNHMANSIWEGRTQGRVKPSPNASREERESWIRAKYEQRAFVTALKPGPGIPTTDDGMPARLLSAVTERDLPRLLLLLAHSTKELINAQPASSGTALHSACQLGDAVMTQLLIWYGIDVKARDTQGQTAIMLARKSGSKGCIDILLQHGCSETSPATATPVLSRRSSTDSLGRTNSRKPVS
ncbi:arf-GAP with GTPase, ANK repeat and PH domain-containing protein 2 isoform X3 [Nerophis lumbriciformis]|uniref:arf-GAP with GTPase, ANK repeat and PH domain-containing protein 2 isoform X3 n=1 Tax=Nerophis lumbriciformis TaxID=546530 RepID=UPI002ADFEDDF|nr:arf-GAP with GTPase, ANK repeat and PH domain-containing protein 1-like isoform X3 [Nerophis lumbriciformis]